MHGQKNVKFQVKLLADIIAKYETYKIRKPVSTQNVKTSLHLMLKLAK